MLLRSTTVGSGVTNTVSETAATTHTATTAAGYRWPTDKELRSKVLHALNERWTTTNRHPSTRWDHPARALYAHFAIRLQSTIAESVTTAPGL